MGRASLLPVPCTHGEKVRMRGGHLLEAREPRYGRYRMNSEAVAQEARRCATDVTDGVDDARYGIECL